MRNGETSQYVIMWRPRQLPPPPPGSPLDEYCRLRPVGFYGDEDSTDSGSDPFAADFAPAPPSLGYLFLGALVALLITTAVWAAGLI